MPPRRNPNTNHTELPSTNEELARMISEHVNAALGRQNADLSVGRGRGHGNQGGGTNDRTYIGSSSENQKKDVGKKVTETVKRSEEPKKKTVDGKPDRPCTGCFECGAEGHFNKDCPKLKVPNAKSRMEAGDGGAAGGGKRWLWRWMMTAAMRTSPFMRATQY
ncbi:hypothetical protein L1987_37856 [Smallanthus sonchifolius]|uniref:Uncharacterized protein n=1 Tax=Smallanthus sonchifolius TaxID=185202 RepID=A0ACB9HK33_9ASTR|nr:hypothetical protein L1987_37856 [Smallanthus sonchifolius]